MRTMMRLCIALPLVCGWAGRANAQDWKQWVPKLPSSPRSEQKEGARHLMPATMKLRAADEAPRAPHVIRVRVWAAADFRRQTREWQSRFRRLVERVNASGRDWPGLRFEVVEQRNWTRESSEGAINGLVEELAKLDPGDDVDLVVGLVAALPVFPGSIDNIGMAKLFSRHMVMRSLHDLAEYDAVRRWFDTFTDSERDAILAARKLHKEQVIFLHEWAHTLGLIHVKRAAGIMNPAYDASMSAFDETEARIIDAALRHRAEDGPRWLDGSARELRAIVEATPDGDWDPRDRKELLAMLAPSGATRTASYSPPPSTPPPAAPASGSAEEPLGDAERATVAQALALGRAGKNDEAWHALAPIEAKHPRSAEIKLAACELTSLHPSGAARATLTEVACKAAAELAPRDPRPHLFIADLYLGAGDASRAQLPLARAGELIESFAADAACWRFYALTLEKAHQPTLAERAAAHADPATAAAVAKRAAAQRRHVGMPDKLAASPLGGTEAEYIRAVEAALSALGTPRESANLTALEREFGDLGAADFVRCEGALERGAIDRARSACRSVLTKAPPRASLLQLRAAWNQSFGP
jgi:hypothetical protein